MVQVLYLASLLSLSLSVSHSFVYRENGGKGVRAGHHQHQELQQQQSVVQSTSSGSGSGSMAPATASVAMWTAISNPLLLISHVLRRSMDLQQSSGVNDESMTVESDETSHRQQELLLRIRQYRTARRANVGQCQLAESNNRGGSVYSHQQRQQQVWGHASKQSNTPLRVGL